MAFPVPSHLPRKKDPQDVSTRILTKISEATSNSLNTQLASSWIAELDDAITQTKAQIHERIHDDLPAFEQQLTAAQSIQERLRTLTSNVDKLSSSLSDPETGIVPSLISTLTKHAALAREVMDADVRHKTLSYLLHCRDDFRALTALIQEGKLPEAVTACAELEKIMAAAPAPLGESAVMADLKRNFAATKARTEEQLNDAYARSIIISPSELIVRPQIQVRQSGTVIPLPSILSSLSPSSLASQLTSLRRDINTHCIEHLLKQPVMVVAGFAKDISGALEYKLSLVPAPPGASDVSARLENLASVLTFLHTHLFPHLPTPELSTFPRSLCKPLRTAVLAHVLAPSLPSSTSHLPAFLALADKAVAFEANVVGAVLGDSSGEQEIKAWTNGVGMHYERRRRVDILERARSIVVRAHDESRAFRVELEIRAEREDSAPASASASAAGPEPESEAAWGFDDEPAREAPAPAPAEENGWNFDDEVDTEPEPEPPQTQQQPDDSGDPGDAWGWNDDAEAVEEVEEDDPWGDAWDEKPQKAVPKPATRLEKFTAKGKSPSASAAVSPLATPSKPAPAPAPSQPTPPAHPVVQESYLVSGRTQELVRLVADVIAEGAELATSEILATRSSAGSPSGTVIMQAAPLALELYRALYPVTNATELAASARRCMLFANDCLHLAEEVGHVTVGLGGAALAAKEKLEEGVEHLKLLGECVFEETLDRQNQLINDLLNKAGGFVDTTDQDRFDDCESAVSKALQRTRQLAQQWKIVLNKSKYYSAIGSAVDAVLSRMLADILALPDITEVESHRLSELSRIMNASEGLFVEDPEQPSFVVSYVPSWLKFSYLSELLEASIADISYLFEAGALVDFEIDELVKLVRALFADTPLRTRTIEKLLQGHSVAIAS
ncbi:Centromere/kinetochore Zw10-domain-containing protein [Amylocystis lapponica]|nr:Centromere/kinetochore Zw10-domain-containing protein [Amylocystis lapponica]